jgi:hypothetical protein
MRADLHKVLTEQPRRGSDSRNLKTRVRFKDYDDTREDRYSLPITGKMLMGNRDLGPHDESKDFTDKLGPLTRWLDSQTLHLPAETSLPIRPGQQIPQSPKCGGAPHRRAPNDS